MKKKKVGTLTEELVEMLQTFADRMSTIYTIGRKIRKNRYDINSRLDCL